MLVQRLAGVGSLLLVLVSSAACGPDPLLGSYNFSITGGEDVNTAPVRATSTPTGTGTMTVTVGTSSDYVLTVSHMGASPCTINAARSGGLGLSIPAGQTCTFRVNNTDVTAMFTSGQGTLNGNVLTLTVNYNYTFTVGVSFAGMGSRIYTATRMM